MAVTRGVLFRDAGASQTAFPRRRVGTRKAFVAGNLQSYLLEGSNE
jgi:hypothetical protein